MTDQELLQRRAAALARRKQRTDREERNDAAVFRLARERFALDLRCLLQIFPLRELALLPGARPPLVGLTPWRGELLRVLDLGAALGRPVSGIADRSRVLVLGSEERAEFGFQIDAVEDVIALADSDVRPLPESDDEHARLLRGVTSDAVVVLDGDELLRTFT